MKFGFDLDGVIAEVCIPEWLLMGQVKDEKVQETIRELLHAVPKLKFHPREFLLNGTQYEGDEYVIITARARKFRDITIKWLKSHGISTSSLFFCDVGTAEMYESVEVFFDVMARKKAQYIKSECIDVFFEDSPDTVERLRKLCPKVLIIQVGGRLK